MSTALDRFLKVQSDGPGGALTLQDWNGLVTEVGGSLDELRAKAAGFDEVSRVAIEILLQRVNDVLGPAFDDVQAKAALVTAILAQLNGQGVSADAVLDTVARVLVTPDQRAAIGATASLVANILAGSTADLNTFAEVALAIAAKLDASAKASNAQAQAGTDDVAYMTSAKTAAAIKALVVQKRFDNVVMFTSSRVWTAPGNIRGRVTVIGPGGSGAYTIQPSTGTVALATGGGAGGLALKAFTATAGQQFTATVGTPGAPATTASAVTLNNGFDGGQSSFVGNALNVVANGGKGGRSLAVAGTAAGALGGTASGGDINLQGGGSGSSTATSSSGAAATGGGAVAWLGVGYSSGAATVGAGQAAASGGAGLGGNSAAAAPNTATGGGGCSGPSVDINGGPDISGISGGAGTAFGTMSFELFSTYGGGGAANIQLTGNTAVGVAGGSGAGGGSGVAVGGGPAMAGVGGLFAGVAGVACYSTSNGNGAIGKTASYGAGSGGQANVFVGSISGATPTTGFAGGPSVIILEYDLVS